MPDSTPTTPFVPGNDTPTTAAPPPTGVFAAESVPPNVPTGSASPARNVALVPDATVDPNAELVPLLRRRLRGLALLLLAAYTAFLIRDIFAPNYGGMWVQKLVFAVVTPLFVLFAGFTWTRWANSLRWLRCLEWAVLLTSWTALAVVQFYWMRVSPHGPGADDQVMAANTWVFPWFALIAGYPVIVPNPPRRTLLIAGLMAAVPFLLTLAAMVNNPQLTFANTRLMFLQYAIWCALGVGVAVYGAHQSGLLRRQVFEARRFGQYRLTRRLGGGGMGDVYLAEHLLLKRPSVVKVIRAERAHDPAILKRFEREVRILATLTHWNTVAVFDHGFTADGTFYFVMEYLPGFDLDDLVYRFGPMPPGRVVHLLRQVCAALREAHAAGLIHRDVKPSNVMVCDRGGVPDVAKLLDFGLVQVAAGDASDRITTHRGMILGTPSYMSPEQGAGKPLDARSDVYSLGATAYFLLTGTPPFTGNNMMEIIAAHLVTPPRPVCDVNAGVPGDLGAVVMRCLAKAPADRFATVAELDAALGRCECAAGWDAAQAAEWWAARGCALQPG